MLGCGAHFNKKMFSGINVKSYNRASKFVSGTYGDLVDDCNFDLAKLSTHFYFLNVIFEAILN